MVASPPSSRRGSELLPLTGLRAVAAWWVVAFHFGRDHFSNPLLRELVSSGHVAVDLFFVLSGFVLARRYAPGDVATRGGRRAFWRRRFARVYPLYAVSLALGFASEWPRSLQALATASGLVRLAAQLGLLNALCHLWMFRINWAAWSLSVEASFYLAFPWIVAWASRREAKRLIAWCVVAALVAPALYTALDPDHLGRPLALGDEVLWSWYLKFFPLQRLPMFVAGVAAGRLSARVTLPRRSAALAAAVVLAVASAPLVPYAFLQGGALLLPFVVLVMALASDGGPSRLGAAVPVALGRASYATYILHVPLFMALARVDPSLWTSPSHLVAYGVALLVLSIVAHRFVEEPARVLLARAPATAPPRTPSRTPWGSVGTAGPSSSPP